jgi:hypothetical protein
MGMLPRFCLCWTLAFFPARVCGFQHTASPRIALGFPSISPAWTRREWLVLPYVGSWTTSLAEGGACQLQVGNRPLRQGISGEPADWSTRRLGGGLDLRP